MKANLFKRLGTLVLGCIMVLSLSATAFAAEPYDSAAEVVEDTVPAGVIYVAPHSSASIEAESIVGAAIQAWGHESLYPVFSSSGFGKTLKIITSTDSGNASGYAEFTLKNPSGSVISDSTWKQSLDISWSYNVGYATKGTYTLTVYNYSDVTLVVTAQWL